MDTETNFIPVASPWITQLEIDYAAEAAATAWNKNHYVFNTRFEKLFAEYVGAKHAVSLPHCTSAIHLSLAAMGVGPGDEVIVPDVTWIASVAPVIYVGASPIFADIDPLTWCLDPLSVRRSITKATKAIIGVNLYGSMANWTELRTIANENNLFLIEDSAEALGSVYKGAKAGSFGDTAVFSFHGSKTVVTGEGGMLVTSDDHIHSRVMTLRDHGRRPGDRFFINQEVAFKYKMSALQAAIGLAQMERIEELIEKKREIFALYKERLLGKNGISINAEPEDVANSFWMVTVVLSPSLGLTKFPLMEELRQRGIDSRPFFSPLSKLPAFQDKPEFARFLPAHPAGHIISDYGVNLPSGYNMDERKVEIVVTALNDVIAHAGSAAIG